MSTELGILKATGSRMVDMAVTRYWGGDKRGMCIQLTADMEPAKMYVQSGYVQLCASDIVALLPIFRDILNARLGQRKKEAEKAIADNKELLHTIVKDMQAVAEMGIQQPVWDMNAVLNFGKTVFEEAPHD